jgi:hypothetical protein
MTFTDNLASDVSIVGFFDAQFKVILACDWRNAVREIFLLLFVFFGSTLLWIIQLGLVAYAMLKIV